jgi:hypothetical protein
MKVLEASIVSMMKLVKSAKTVKTEELNVKTQNVLEELRKA